MGSAKAFNKSESKLTARRKRAFVRDLRRAGIAAKRSTRLAQRFVSLATPEVHGTAVAKKKGWKVYKVSLKGHSASSIYVTKAGGRIVVHASGFGADGRKRVNGVKAHR